MKKNRVKNFSFLGGVPANIYDGSVDVLVTLEDDDSEYWLEVTTPQFFASYMKEKNQRFLEPMYPDIIVRELTPAVIKEAIEAFIMEEEESFWFKLYYLIPYLTIDDLNLIEDRRKKEIEDSRKKEMEAEEE